jgi:ADP-ribose pyrophosphatase
MKDQPREVTTSHRREEYRGAVWGVIKEDLEFGGKTITRDFLQHMGAVAIVAINENGEVLTVTQYRHAVGMELVEIPAGLLDELNESPLEAAQRELLEETGYTASTWYTLVDMCTTPGSSSEAIRIFLACDVQEHPWNSAELLAEESQMIRTWVPLNDAVEHILAGDWTSPTAVCGILAYVANGDNDLRSPDAPWAIRQRNLDSGRIFKK